jgi:hypothetical protein
MFSQKRATHRVAPTRTCITSMSATWYEPGGLQVGQEPELDKINHRFFGKTHENIGNLVGWVS